MSYILLHVLAYNLNDKSSACCCHYDPSHLLMLSNTRPARKGETDKELLLWGWKTVNYRCCRKKRIKKKTELNGEVKIIEGRVKTWIPLWAEMQKKKNNQTHISFIQQNGKRFLPVSQDLIDYCHTIFLFGLTCFLLDLRGNEEMKQKMLHELQQWGHSGGINTLTWVLGYLRIGHELGFTLQLNYLLFICSHTFQQ